MRSRDKYRNFAELIAAEREGHDYKRIAVRRDSMVAVIAPHGGGIESGTSELATALAGAEFSLYCFEGLKRAGNYESLHITSTNFDDPVCLQIIEQSNFVLAVHGCEGREKVVFVGGRNDRMKCNVIEALRGSGLEAVEDLTNHSGREVNNICNKGCVDGGVQLEISKGLRQSMFEGLSRAQRRITTHVFASFVSAVRDVLTKVEMT